MRSDYEERREARIDRYRERSTTARQAAEQRFNSGNVQAVIAMQGEPIKIGHHSEKRHRRLIEKADRDMAASVQLTEKAKHYARKAVAAENNRAISSDDPEAVRKLSEKLDTAARFQATMKAANKIVRSKKLTDDQKIAKLADIDGLNETSAAKLLEPDFCGRIGFPAYMLQNNNANIKRMRQRLDDMIALDAAAETGDTTTVATGDGWELVENPVDNRVQFFFNGKPDEATRSMLKRHGFRWARSIGAWQRIMTANGTATARMVADMLPK